MFKCTRIASAIKRGVKFGRKPRFDNEKTAMALQMQKDGMLNQEIAEHFKIARSTLLRWIAKYKKEISKEEI